MLGLKADGCPVGEGVLGSEVSGGGVFFCGACVGAGVLGSNVGGAVVLGSGVLGAGVLVLGAGVLVLGAGVLVLGAGVLVLEAGVLGASVLTGGAKVGFGVPELGQLGLPKEGGGSGMQASPIPNEAMLHPHWQTLAVTLGDSSGMLRVTTVEHGSPEQTKAAHCVAVEQLALFPGAIRFPSSDVAVTSTCKPEGLIVA